MDETELAQCIDFMDIGLEQLERGNTEVAQDFFEDVNATLQEAHAEES